MIKHITDLPELKELMTLKINTYISRMLDFTINCQHIHNIEDLAMRTGVDKDQVLYTVNRDNQVIHLGGINALRAVTIAKIGELKEEFMKELEDSVHPHSLADLSERLDKMIGE